MEQNNNFKNLPWQEEENNTPQKNFNFPWKGFFIVLFIILALAAAIVGYIFYKPNPPQISIEFQKPDKILSGESFNLKVIIHNDSGQSLSNARLVLTLPEGIMFLEDDPNKKINQVDLGEISSLGLREENFKLIAFSPELTIKNIQAKLIYKLSNSNISFENNFDTDLSINQAAFNVSISAPEKIYNAQNFKILIKYQNNSNYDFDNVFLKINYPPIFKFVDANPKPENNLWNIGKVKSRDSGSIELTGQLIGSEGQSANFLIEALTLISGKSYALTSQNYNFSIAKSDLALNILLNNENNYIANLGDKLDYVFQYKNNSSFLMENVVLTARLESDLFDFSDMQTNSYFNSLTNTFIWNAANQPDFKALAPQAQGEIHLKLKLKDKFNILNVNDKNFTLKVYAQIESPTVPEGVSSNRTIFTTNFETKVRGRVDFSAFALYRDPNWQIINKGPYPPKVNQSTQYSIHWVIKNYANDLSNVLVYATLPPGTKFTNLYKSNIDVKLNYNPDSGLIQANIFKIPANRGVLDNPIEIVFQVENTPSLTEIGQDALLISESSLEVNNEFTSENLTYKADKVLTNLPNDLTIKIKDRRVQN
ncbi:MAG: hypothetical protein ACPL3E_00005 [Minisyncoccia bacterium]